MGYWVIDSNGSITNQGSLERRPVTEQPSIHSGSSRTFCFSLFELSLLSQQWRRDLAWRRLKLSSNGSKTRRLSFLVSSLALVPSLGRISRFWPLMATRRQRAERGRRRRDGSRMVSSRPAVTRRGSLSPRVVARRGQLPPPSFLLPSLLATSPLLSFPFLSFSVESGCVL